MSEEVGVEVDVVESDEGLAEEAIEVEVDENGREIVKIYLEDLEDTLETLAQLEDEEDIGDKVERALVNERNIYLTGTIEDELVNSVVQLIHFYNIEDEKNNVSDDERISIKLLIDSPGGSLTSGKKLLSAMENSKTPIETISQGGQIASMAFVIFVFGDIRKMSRFSETMFHNILAGMEGTYSEMKNRMSYYERLQNEMDEYVAEKTKIPMKKLKKLRSRNQDWHLTFNECKQYGVFDVEI